LEIELDFAENERVTTATAAARAIVEVVIVNIVIESARSYFRFMLLLVVVAVAGNCFYFVEYQHYLEWHLDYGWLNIPNSKLWNSSCFFGNCYD